MTEKPAYYDTRSKFWRRHFEMAANYDDWTAESNQKLAQRWIDQAVRTPKLSEGQRERLAGYDRKLNVLLYGGIWCGDCARSGPMLKRIAEACGELVVLRVIDREASEELKDELRILGATRVPFVVFLSEDFWEVDRFGDRSLSVYRAKANREIGRGFPSGILSPRALAEEMEEWVDVFERVLIMLRLAPQLRKRYGD